MVVLAALCYSLTTVRIGYFAASLQPLQLALAKSSGLTALAAGARTFLQPFLHGHLGRGRDSGVPLEKLSSGLPNYVADFLLRSSGLNLHAGWLAASCASAVAGGQPLQSLWEGYRSPTAWLALFLMAASGAGAAALQSRVRSEGLRKLSTR